MSFFEKRAIGLGILNLKHFCPKDPTENQKENHIASSFKPQFYSEIEACGVYIRLYVVLPGPQFDGIFIGASQTVELRNAMIISVVIYLVCSFFLIASFGNSGLWLSLCIFFIARALTLFFYLGRIYKRVY